jgi:molecular chaperone GrpE
MKRSNVDEHTPADVVDAGVSANGFTDVAELQSRIEELETELQLAKDRELRNLADYQNLLRRTQEERGKFIKMATRDFVEELVQPLDHLSLAAAQLNDNGLNMVIEQLWSVLKQHGLEEIAVLGKPFNPETMEVVEKQGQGEVVTTVVKKGYSLNGDVVQFAKVIVGDSTH